MKLPVFLILTFCFLVISCSNDDAPISEEIDSNLSTIYFPPVPPANWEVVDATSLGWDSSKEEDLITFLEEKNTKAFIILKDGRIALEVYFGDFTQNDNHAWNSAGKTLTAFTTGIAQQEGFLSLEDSSSDYLGQNWSMLEPTQEANITIFNHLTMTTGLDYEVEDTFCTDPECLIYKNEPDTFWFYHNGPYTLLDNIITNAVGQDFETYFSQKVRDQIGMQGSWIKIGYNNVYFSNARSMARFGLLNLNNGKWEESILLSDVNYFNDMITTSQDLNPSYGYLWWLNGKSSYKVPGAELQLNGELIPNAPSDLIAGLGRNDQKLYVVPSNGLVIVRMGGDAGETLLGPSSFDNELWEKLNDYIN